jgi:DNA-binding transcriptional regulator GbsR (MarR family)
LLTQLSFVEFYTKPGERKRHFRGTGNYLRSTLEEHFHNVERELRIVEKINRFNRDRNPDKFVADESLGSLFQDYLNLQKSNLESTLKKMIEFKTENHQ